jgi:hypothetical protein
MTWDQWESVFAPNAVQKHLIKETCLARRNVVHNAAQRCSGKVHIIINCGKKSTKKILMKTSVYAVPFSALVSQALST